MGVLNSMTIGIGKILSTLNGESYTKEELIKMVDNLQEIVLKENILKSLDYLTMEKGGEYPFAPLLEDNNYVQGLKSFIGVNLHNCIEVIEELKAGFQDIYDQMDRFKELLEKNLPATINTSKTGAFTGMALKYIFDLNVMSFYILDFLWVVIDTDIESKDSKGMTKTYAPKHIVENIRENMRDFSILWRVYGKDMKRAIDDLSNLIDGSIEIDADGSDSMVEAALRNDKQYVNTPTTGLGFVGNPIYHFRLWLADKDYEKYEYLKAQEKKLQTKLLELEQARITGNTKYDNKKLDKIIENINRDLVNKRRKIEEKAKKNTRG